MPKTGLFTCDKLSQQPFSLATKCLLTEKETIEVLVIHYRQGVPTSATQEFSAHLGDFFHICIFVPHYMCIQTLKVQVQIVYCCVSLSEEVPVRGLDAKSSDNGAQFWTLHTSGYTSRHYATLLHFLDTRLHSSGHYATHFWTLCMPHVPGHFPTQFWTICYKVLDTANLSHHNFVSFSFFLVFQKSEVWLLILSLKISTAAE